MQQVVVVALVSSLTVGKLTSIIDIEFASPRGTSVFSLPLA